MVKKQWSEISKKQKRNGIIGLVVLALVVIVIISALINGNKKPSTSAFALGSYADASQIVQVLKTHNVPCNNVTKDTGTSSFTGAISGVWAETAPGDAAAHFGGSENAGTDTEIVVFKNHADAVAYVDIGNDSDNNHHSILGTNWAIDAATPAVARIRSVLGGTFSWLDSHIISIYTKSHSESGNTESNWYGHNPRRGHIYWWQGHSRRSLRRDCWRWPKWQFYS